MTPSSQNRRTDFNSRLIGDPFEKLFYDLAAKFTKANLFSEAVLSPFTRIPCNQSKKYEIFPFKLLLHRDCSMAEK